MALEQLRRLFEDGKHTGEVSYLRQAEQLLAGENSKVYLLWECIKTGKLEEASELVENCAHRKILRLPEAWKVPSCG